MPSHPDVECLLLNILKIMLLVWTEWPSQFHHRNHIWICIWCLSQIMAACHHRLFAVLTSWELKLSHTEWTGFLPKHDVQLPVEELQSHNAPQRDSTQQNRINTFLFTASSQAILCDWLMVLSAAGKLPCSTKSSENLLRPSAPIKAHCWIFYLRYWPK